MLILDKIRGLNQLYAKYFVLKRVLPGFTASWHAKTPQQHHPETLGLTEGPVQTSEIKIIAYPDFPYAPGHELLSCSSFTQAYLLSTHTQQASLCISSTYLRAWASQEDYRCAVAFLDAKRLTPCTYPLPVPNQNAPILSLSCDLVHTHTSQPPHKLLQNTACYQHFICSSEMTDTEGVRILL